VLRDTSAQDRVIQPKHKLKPAWIATAVIATVLVVGLLTTLPALSSLFSADMTVNQDRLRFAVVERGNLQRDVSVQGRIVASNSPTLFARSGGIVSLTVKAGDKVEQGQIIASIDSPELNSLFSQELAVLEQQKIEVGRYQIQMKTEVLNNQQSIELSAVDLDAAAVNLHRAQVSIKDSLISQREFEERTAEHRRYELEHAHAKQQFALIKESMEFELQSRKSQLARQQYVVNDLQRQVEELQLIAPASGIIGSVNVRDRDQVQANAPLITLIDLSAFEVEVSIPENYADDLNVGLTSEITFNGAAYQGEVVAISPEVTNGQVQGRIRFDNTSIANLRQNQRVNARIFIESRDNVLKVKRGAFVESGGGRLTYLVKGDIAVKHPIQIGARSLSEVEVLSGLSEGDRIVISSLEAIKQQNTIYISQ